MLIHLWTKVTKQLAAGVINGTIHVSHGSRIDYDGRESGNVLTSKTSYVLRCQHALWPRHVVARTSRRFHAGTAWDCYRTCCREIKRKKFTSVAHEGTWRVLSDGTRDATTLSRDRAPSLLPLMTPSVLPYDLAISRHPAFSEYRRYPALVIYW